MGKSILNTKISSQKDLVIWFYREKNRYSESITFTRGFRNKMHLLFQKIAQNKSRKAPITFSVDTCYKIRHHCSPFISRIMR